MNGTGDQPISWLMFFTLGAGALILIGAFVAHLRSRHNREITANALQGDGKSRGVEPSGALTELVGVAVVAVGAMALLTVGIHTRGPDRVASADRPATTTGPATTGMAQKPGLQNEPKQYQPANPAPDPRAAPTSSDTGSGPANGSTGSPQGTSQ